MGGSGAAVGVLAGGVLTKWLGWEWIFFVNVPVGACGARAHPVGRAREPGRAGERRFDAAGAVLITSALSLLVYALTQANRAGWASAQTIGILVASAVLHVAFLAVEHRSQAPLVPLGIFARLRTLTGANVVSFLLGGADLRDVLHALALHAAGARPLRAPDGRRLPGGRADRDRLRRRRAGARDEGRA